MRDTQVVFSLMYLVSDELLCCRSPPAVGSTVCTQLTGQTELTDCHQTVWTYAARAGFPSGSLVVNVSGLNWSWSHFWPKVFKAALIWIFQVKVHAMIVKSYSWVLFLFLCLKPPHQLWGTTLIPSRVGWNRNKYLKRIGIVDMKEH